MGKQKKERRTKQILVRLTPTEWRALAKAAKEEGATVAWIFRRWAFVKSKKP